MWTGEALYQSLLARCVAFSIHKLLFCLSSVPKSHYALAGHIRYAVYWSLVRKYLYITLKPGNISIQNKEICVISLMLK